MIHILVGDTANDSLPNSECLREQVVIIWQKKKKKQQECPPSWIFFFCLMAKEISLDGKIIIGDSCINLTGYSKEEQWHPFTVLYSVWIWQR